MKPDDIVIPPGWEKIYDRWHYAPAVRDGDDLRCSGCIGVGPDGTISPDPELQFQTFVFMKVKDEFVRTPYPAWTAVGVTELARPNALIEVKVTARVRS